MIALCRHLSLFVAACVFLSACTTIRLDEDLADYSHEVSSLQQQLLVDPQSEDALRDLGAIYIRTGYPAEGHQYLQRAFSNGDREPKTLFFLGLANENLGRAETARRLYESYSDVSSLSPYRRLMQGRYAWLVREAAHKEIQDRLATESDITDSEIVPNVIAIFPLTYLGDDNRWNPIGRGLAEMMTIDLQNVSRIRIVERARLQAILSELELGATNRVDQSSAPRLGRLLRAGKVVGGTYNVLSEDDLRLDVSFVETLTSELSDLPSQTDALNNFFRLEKQIVFSLLDKLGIELTEAEQIEIQRVPTQNLQAFLAFSRGLREEDENNYEAAARSFERANALDPDFSLASVRSNQATGLGDAAGSSFDLLLSAIAVEPNFGPPIDLMASRIDQLSSGIGSTMTPGADDRDPVEEATLAGVTTAELLPTPPPPPGPN